MAKTILTFANNSKVRWSIRVDWDGRVTSLVPEYQGQLVKDADKNIIKISNQRGYLPVTILLVHNYPFCWR